VNPGGIDVVSIPLPSHITSLCSPRGGRTCGEKARLSHIDRGPLTRTGTNKAFTSLLTPSCSPHVDLSLVIIALSRGWRRVATDARINNAEEFAKCVIFPHGNVLSRQFSHLFFHVGFFLGGGEDAEGVSTTERETVTDTGRKCGQIWARDYLG